MRTNFGSYLFGSRLLGWGVRAFPNCFTLAENKIYPKAEIEILSTIKIGIQVLIFHQVNRCA